MPALASRGFSTRVKSLRVPDGQRFGAVGDEPELRGGIEPIGGEEPGGGELLPSQRRDADLVELIEVAREDRRELDPLEERDAGVLDQRQDALVEVEPRQLPIDEPGREL